MKKRLGTLVLLFLTVLVMEIAIYWAFLGAPTEKTQGDIQRIFYFHLGSIAVSFLGFLYVLVVSVIYLVTKNSKWDAQGLIAGEVGLLLSTIVLVTGPIWAKPTWGVWWAFDARLTSMLILWLIFLAYTQLGEYVHSASKAPTLRAVFGIVGAAMVPFVYMSTRWFETQHPKPVIAGGEDSGLDPKMWVALLIAFCAFSLLYFLYCLCGSWIMRMESKANQLLSELRYLED